MRVKLACSLVCMSSCCACMAATFSSSLSDMAEAGVDGIAADAFSGVEGAGDAADEDDAGGVPCLGVDGVCCAGGVAPVATVCWKSFCTKLLSFFMPGVAAAASFPALLALRLV